MTDSDSETKALLQSPTKEEYLNESDETTTTDDECEEIYVDSHSNFARFQNFDREIHEDPLNQQQSSSGISSLKIDKAFDVVHYFAKDIQSSSDSSGKVSSTASSVDLGCTIEYTTDEFGNVDYVDVDMDDSVGPKHISKLMNKLRLNHYTAISYEGDFTISKCKGLFDRDYSCEIIENSGGCLSKHYPARLIIPVARRFKMANFERLDSVQFDPQQYRERVTASVSSRLMTRFVAPVIMFDKKFICRAGTLTVRKSAVFETARQSEPPKNLEMAACALQEKTRRLAHGLVDLSKRGCKAASQLLIPSSIEKIRDVDAEILRNLNIQHVCDLMIETRKMFKQTIRISSSEKINRDIYSDCAIEQMPYPGNKLFGKYHEANHKPEGLIFDWTRPDVNIEMEFSEDPSVLWPDVNWENYKEWDVVDLTKNYLKMILTYLARDKGGILLHCISGWDRTPLFISMLRVSLWADGVIHESLNHKEMAYLTLAYDWYLFGHDLPNRLRKNQEIMHFCFKFLEYITTDEFSITRIFHQLPPEDKEGRIFPDYVPEKRKFLGKFSAYVLRAYDEFITKRSFIS